MIVKRQVAFGTKQRHVVLHNENEPDQDLVVLNWCTDIHITMLFWVGLWQLNKNAKKKKKKEKETERLPNMI